MDMSIIYYMFAIMFALMGITAFISYITSKWSQRKKIERNLKDIQMKHYREKYSAARLNKVKRVKKVYLSGDKYVPRRLVGKYAGHVYDNRMMLIFFRRGLFWFFHRPRNKLLLVPWELGPSLLSNEIVIEARDLDRQDIYFYPKVRKDHSPITQEEVERRVSEYIHYDMMTRYDVSELNAQGTLSQVYAANTSPQRIIQRIVKRGETKEEQEAMENEED